MTETTNQTPFAFTLDRSTIRALIAAGLVLVAAILAAVAVGVDWATYDSSVSAQGQQFSDTGTYGMFEVSGTEYTSENLDDFDGIGMARAGGPLFLTGMIVAFVATIGIFASTIVTPKVVRLVTLGLGLIATVLLILGTVFLPIGIADLHANFEGTQGGFGATAETTPVTFGAGLVLAAIGTALAVAGIIVGIMSLRSTDADNTASA